MRHSRTLRASAILGIVFAAACSDKPSLGPGTLVDPTVTASALAAFDSAFASTALQSFSVLGVYVQPTAGVAAAGRMLSATQPAPFAAGVSPEAGLARRFSRLRDFASLSASAQGLLIPDSLYGSIFTWDSASASYTRSQTTGGPANGVRFVLYAINPLTGTVSFPLTPVGRLDLLDESSGAIAQLHVIVQGNDGTPTYLDYTTTLTVGVGSATATVSGMLTNALPAPNDKTLSFTANAAFLSTAITVDATYTLNNPAFSVNLSVRQNVGQANDTLAVEVLISRPNEAVDFVGGLVLTAGVVDTVNATITVNSQLYATVAGNASGVTFYDKNGVAIEDTAQQHDILMALDQIRHVAEGVLAFTAALFQPILGLLLG